MPKSTAPRPPLPPTIRGTRRAAASRHVQQEEESPTDLLGWVESSNRLLTAGDLEAARTAAGRALALDEAHVPAWVLLGHIETGLGNLPVAETHFKHALSLDANSTAAQLGLATVLSQVTNYVAALFHIEEALKQDPDHLPALSLKALTLKNLARYEEAGQVLEALIKRDPQRKASYSISLANVKRDMGLFEEAEALYKQAAKSTSDPAPLSNLLTLLHYIPGRTPEDILKACKNWGSRFTRTSASSRPRPGDLSPRRKIRVGMFSDGFRQHPVGAMITPPLEQLQQYGFEIYAYTSNGIFDPITERIKAASTSWMPIQNLSDEAFAEQIRADGIDILIDLAGHNAGTRMRTMAMEPAPLLVKWVGGLINTTGVKAIDYLITDAVESPLGSDAFYTEKLIRMPDDYICYMPPARIPDVAPLPALENGHITFGCFNNPTKINEVVLAEWARLLNEVPGSKLVLKGRPYESQEMRDRLARIFIEHGGDPTRLVFEGQSLHYPLFQAYNRIDIALDPWPYSGGLTTCEAMMMGVPVVTLPGPTFAGRHSATHLANAGMPELVAENWDQYRKVAVQLASDLQALSTVRAHLRQVLLKSPVCDGSRFARNLATALRAIWQRYCQKQSPAALAFTADGKPWFEDEDAPVAIRHPQLARQEEADSFDFAFQGKIITLDHGGALVGGNGFAALARQQALQAIAIDPAGQITGIDLLRQQGHLQHYHSHTALGDGEPAKLHACLDATLSGTLEPLPASQQLPFARQGATVLATLPMPTTRVGDIEGLERVDWLALNETHDNLNILRGAQRYLGETLVVQVAVLFTEIFRNQPDLTAITELLRGHGLRLLRVEHARYRSYFPDALAMGVSHGGSQLLTGDAIFVPDAERITSLNENRRLKLAFILHGAYGATDLAYHLLQQVDEGMADRFLAASRLVRETPAAPAAARDGVSARPDHAAKATNEAGEDAARPLAPVIEAPELLRSRTTLRRAYVGVPIYNEDKYIEQTIRSLKDQDIDNVGFLVCDNVSTDRTLEIVRDVAGGDARFEIFRQPENRGAYTNFKFAYDNTDSEYFMWLGGHDFLSPGYLSAVMEKLDADPDVSMAFGMPYAVTEDARDAAAATLVPGGIYDFKGLRPVERYVKSVADLSNCTIVHSLFRRKHLNDFEMREAISGDHVLISHLLWKGELAYVEDAKYYRRYFKARTETAAERITGTKRELTRADFYQYYMDSLTRLGKGVLNAAQGAQVRRNVKDILIQRFGK